MRWLASALFACGLLPRWNLPIVAGGDDPGRDLLQLRLQESLPAAGRRAGICLSVAGGDDPGRAGPIGTGSKLPVPKTMASHVLSSRKHELARDRYPGTDPVTADHFRPDHKWPHPANPQTAIDDRPGPEMAAVRNIGFG